MTNNKRKRERKVPAVTPMAIKDPEPQVVTDIIKENSIDQITIGWENATEVAAEIWRQGNISLLDGDLLFAYRNTESANSGLYQIVVVKYFDWKTPIGEYNAVKEYNGLYGYSLVTAGYSAAIPRVGSEYLEEIYRDLVTFKVDKRILTIFRNIIDNETASN